jgi:hypothetical protein
MHEYVQKILHYFPYDKGELANVTNLIFVTLLIVTYKIALFNNILY